MIGRIVSPSITLAGALLLAGGCGTVFQGLRQEVQISSTPDGAEAMFAGQPTQTPGRVTVRRQEWAVARAMKDGYAETCKIVPGRHNPWLALLNSIPAGAGWIIDRPTQANRRFPDDIHLDLPQGTSGSLLPSDEEIIRQWTEAGVNLCEFTPRVVESLPGTRAAWGASFDIALIDVSPPGDRSSPRATPALVRANRYAYRDGLIDIAVQPDLQGIDFKLSNLTTHAMKLLWDETVLIDFDGTSRTVVHSGYRYSDTRTPQAPTVVPPNAFVYERVVPIDRIRRSGSGVLNIGLVPSAIRACDVPEDKFTGEALTYRGKHLALHLQLVIDGAANPYELTFEVRSVTLRYADGCVQNRLMQPHTEVRTGAWMQ